MTALFDFRQTFFRKHLAQELSQTAEVLALEELNKIEGARPLTLHDFFYGGLPGDALLYIPVRVGPLGDDLRDLPTRYFKERPPHGIRPTFDLSYALAALRHFDIAGGIYLRSRSGAGKTVAGLAAMCDCFYGTKREGMPDAAPRLGGFLPCRLRTGDVFKGVRDRFARFKSDGKRQEWLDKQIAAAGSGLIERMVLATAGLAGNGHSRQLRGWMNAGPPLLIFVDLNAFGELERRLMAAALVKFQEESASAGVGHRVVVTYRSATQDGVQTTLAGCKLLHPFDLEPLTPWQAAEYLRTYRRLAAQRAGKAISDAALGAETKELIQFIDDHVTGEESLVSTPLLMHLVTLIPATELREGKVRTLSDLYDRVVHRFFEQDFRRTLTGEVPSLFLDGAPGGAEGNFLVAQCRVALAILAGGESNTRLGGSGVTTATDVLEQLWGEPKESVLWSGGPRWHPTADWWLKGSPYYGSKALQFDVGHRKALVQRTLLHEEDGGYRFLHDSFICYFAAVAVRGYRHASWNHARNKLEGETHAWYEQTAARLHESPRTWAVVAEFLGGMLRPDEVTELSLRMLTAAPKGGWPAVLIRLLDGRRRVERGGAVAAGIDDALHHKEGLVQRCPAALRTEVYHYLRDGARKVPCREFAGRLERAGGWAWLSSRTPTKWPAPMVRASHSVTCVALMPDGSVVFGSGDGVYRWDMIRRRVRTLITHEGNVRAVAVSADGQTVVSSGVDGTVRRWTPQAGADPDPILKHDKWVNAVAVSADGQTVVSGGGDGRVRRWTAEGGAAPDPILTHKYTVTAVAVSADGQTVVSGDGDGRVQLWTPQAGADSDPILTHDKEVRAVAVSADGQTVVSGGHDGRVQRWTPQAGADSDPILTHDKEVNAVGVSADGQTVVSGGGDGRVQRWTPQAGADSDPILTHDEWVLAVAVSADGQTVVSGGVDRRVQRWTPQAGADPDPILTHDQGVYAVAVSADGQTVVSGGGDGRVQRWTPQAGADPDPILKHDKEVNAVAASADGQTVVSGGGDGRVRRWTPEGGADTDPILTHKYTVTAVAVSADGQTVVSGDGDGRVRRWTPQAGADSDPILTHDRGVNAAMAYYERVNAVAVSADGQTVVSGGSDNSVRRWTPQAGADPDPILTHEGNVNAVAVSADGQTVASGGWDNSVRRWTPQAGADPDPILTHDHWVLAVAVSADGQTVVSGGGDCRVRRWTPQGGADPDPILTHDGVVPAVAVSADGQTVVSSGVDGRVRRWTPQAGADPDPILTHDQGVYAVAVSADGQTVVSGGDDGMVQCHHCQHGLVCAFFCNTRVTHLSFADGVGRIGVGGGNGEVCILDLRNFPPHPLS